MLRIVHLIAVLVIVVVVMFSVLSGLFVVGSIERWNRIAYGPKILPWNLFAFATSRKKKSHGKGRKILMSDETRNNGWTACAAVRPNLTSRVLELVVGTGRIAGKEGMGYGLGRRVMEGDSLMSVSVRKRRARLSVPELLGVVGGV